jgi:hypothetical protein
MLPRKRGRRVEQAPIVTAPTFALDSLSEEIDRIVDERRALREAGAPDAELEANRKRLSAVQAELTRLLVLRYG